MDGDAPRAPTLVARCERWKYRQGLRRQLEAIDDFISVERYESLSEPSKLLSLSLWRADAAVACGAITAHRSGARPGPRRDLCRVPAADYGRPVLRSLLEKLNSYPAPPGAKPYRPSGEAAIGGLVVPLKLAVENGTLCFLSTTTEFATALDINLSELVIETLFPADPFTADTMRGLAHADPA